MGLHDQTQVGGITEACKYNDHSQCNNPRCACDCHIKAAVVHAETKEVEVEKQEKACPICGVKRPYRETFCRVDGTRLTSLVCTVCGSGGDAGDVYCWKCGSQLSKGDVSYSPGGTSLQVPSLEPEVEEPEVDYGRQVVAGLQKELAQNVDTGGDDGNQRVVETPMGVQGSFKLVSKPSPVRVRTGAGPAPSGTGPGNVEARPAFRLPVKPS